MENINVKKGTRKSFVLYTSYADQIKLLNESEKAMLLDAIFEYQLTGELSVELCPMVAIPITFYCNSTIYIVRLNNHNNHNSKRQRQMEQHQRRRL